MSGLSKQYLHILVSIYLPVDAKSLVYKAVYKNSWNMSNIRAWISNHINYIVKLHIRSQTAQFGGIFQFEKQIFFLSKYGAPFRDT